MLLLMLIKMGQHAGRIRAYAAAAVVVAVAALGVGYILVTHARATMKLTDLGVLATPSPSRPTHAGSTPLALESCGSATVSQDGNIGPIACPDGRPSRAADSGLRTAGSGPVRVMRLAAGASRADVEGAMCTDVSASGMTLPMENSAYEIRALEEGWTYGRSPEDWLFHNQGCLPD